MVLLSLLSHSTWALWACTFFNSVHFTHISLFLQEDYKLPHNQAHVTTCVQCSLYDGMNTDLKSKHLSSEIWPVIISLATLQILFKSSAPQCFHLQDREQAFPPSSGATVMTGLMYCTHSGTMPPLVKILKYFHIS